MQDPKSVAILGAGASGLITAQVLSKDGFDVQVFTRDHTPGGQWAAERIYPGLQLNNVHGEFSFSCYPMTSPANSSATGGRLTADDLRRYMQEFADTLLPGKIMFDTEIISVSRDKTDSTWAISVRNRNTGVSETRKFAKVVLCTGGTSKPMIPASLSSDAAKEVHFDGEVMHSAHFGAQLPKILSEIPPKTTKSASEEPKAIVIVGGGKSAQDICAYLANQGREVTIVYERTDTFIVSAKPLPDFIRKSRLLSIISPHIHLRTRLERFLHTTWLGNKCVQTNWNAMIADSTDRRTGTVQSHEDPRDSPLRLTYSALWHTRTNDEGIPREDSFYALVNEGKIKVVAPARMTGYGEGRSVLLSNGQIIHADLVILATGYQETAAELGLYRHRSAPQVDEWKHYTTLANPPEPHPDNENWSSSIYKGLVPTKNILRKDFAINGGVFTTNDGYSFEVMAHWISSYFLGDKMNLPSTPEDALNRTEKDSMWLRKRFPDTNLSLNEAHTGHAVFFTWPQYTDELLEDMYLPSMRSGGNWVTWPFKVVDIKELATLHEEREGNRRKNL
ncbi:FAD/NAD-P-binding domain-containing protein [Mycena capillaripes]|nr:FAD/NAD-P-binding domain-containing protein [Mycena capillaripes]